MVKWWHFKATEVALVRGLIQVLSIDSLERDVQGVQEKLCFFTIHCNPSLAYIIAVRDL